jgi:hypothetical protein
LKCKHCAPHVASLCTARNQPNNRTIYRELRFRRFQSAAQDIYTRRNNSN